MKNPLFAGLLLVLGSAGAGCTAKYEDAIRDRDSQLREMSKQVSDLRSELSDLRRREQEARDQLDSERKSPEVKATDSAGKTTKDQESEAGAVKNEIGGDVDVRYTKGRLSIGIPSTVSFASGSATLTAEGQKTLGRVAKVLKDRYKNRRIYVEGHTDTDPIKNTKDKFRTNRHLSAERADAVAAALIKDGVSESHLVIVGFGEFDPVNARGDKARNRRVEVVIGD
jgi:flagellar motor protein MotB